MDEYLLIVFADGAVLGRHPGITALRQGFACIEASGADVDECVARTAAEHYAQVDTGQSSYLVTATLHCLGLGVRPGARVALLRWSDEGQASVVFHQVSDTDEAPADASQTALLPGRSGRGWADALRIIDGPATGDDSPVNAALRELGVNRGDSPDEAAALGLPIERVLDQGLLPTDQGPLGPSKTDRTQGVIEQQWPLSQLMSAGWLSAARTSSRVTGSALPQAARALRILAVRLSTRAGTRAGGVVGSWISWW
jgi:hypothetical protein